MARNKEEVYGGKIGLLGGVFVGPPGCPAPTFDSTGTTLIADGRFAVGILAKEVVAYRTERETSEWEDHDGRTFRMGITKETTTGEFSVAQINLKNLQLAAGSRAAVAVEDAHYEVRSGGMVLDEFDIVILALDETGKKRVAHFPASYITSSNETSLGTDGEPAIKTVEFQAVFDDEAEYSVLEMLEKVDAPASANSLLFSNPEDQNGDTEF